MSRWANKYVIGLTGNIAVGKSVVRQMLQHLGAYTIDADGLAHQAMSPGAPAYKPIVDTFGQFILDSEQRINRAMLGQIVFSNPAALAKLEAITHPIVAQAINTLITRSTQRVIVIEAIKLLEGDLAKAVDAVWVVNAKPETQYRRLLEKRKMSEAEAKQRILAQGAQADKLKQATFVVQNDGNVEETWKQVQIGWAQVQKAIAAMGAPPAAPTTTPPPAKPATPTTPAVPQPKAPAVPPPTTPTPAQPKPAVQTPPAQPKPPTAPPSEEIMIAPPPPAEAGIEVKRGMPGNAAQIAEFITKMGGKSVSRMDIMLAFGQKSYLLAQNQNSAVVGLMGWQVENLITRVDEFYLDPGAKKDIVIQALVNAIEEASKELQSEVGFIFLPAAIGSDTMQPFLNNGYEVTTIAEIKIPAWREAVQEIMSDQTQILRKQLRKDRVLKPI